MGWGGKGHFKTNGTELMFYCWAAVEMAWRFQVYVHVWIFFFLFLKSKNDLYLKALYSFKHFAVLN